MARKGTKEDHAKARGNAAQKIYSEGWGDLHIGLGECSCSGRSVLAGTGIDSTPAKWNAVWSPSGTMLACWVGDRLVLVNANGPGERTLMNATHGERGGIAWQPFGS